MHKILLDITGNRMNLNYSLKSALLFIGLMFLNFPSFAQQATFFTKNGKELTGKLVEMKNDTVIVSTKKSSIKKIHKSFFQKILFSSGEYFDLSLSNWSSGKKESQTEWDQIGLASEENINQEIFTVAVTSFEERGGVTKADAASLADRFTEKLIGTGRFRVMERNEMDLILREQGFQQTGACLDNECLVEIGQLIAVQKIIAATVGKVGGMYSVSVKILDVKTGAIEKNVSEDCDCTIEELMTVIMERLAKKLAGIEVGESSKKIEIKRGDASLFVKTEPEGARVYLNGKLMDGVTPVTLSNLTAGKYNVKTTKGDLEAISKVTLEAHKVTKVNLSLSKKKTVLKISSNPSEAEVYIDGKPGIKKSPDKTTPAIFEGIKAGKYAITLFKVGYKDTSFFFDLQPNQSSDIIINMEKNTDENILKQKRLVKKRKQRKIGLSMDISGGLAIAGGTLFYILGAKDDNEALDAKKYLEESVIKSGPEFDEQLKINQEKSDSAAWKKAVSYSLWGAGALSLGLGLVFTF